MSLRLKNIVKILFLFIPYVLIAQDRYWVFFEDKEESLSLYTPSDFLSNESLQRRFEQGIAVIENDYPISPQYIGIVEQLGCRIHQKSRWLNAVSVHLDNEESLAHLKALSFVENITPVASYSNLQKENVDYLPEIFSNSYGPSYGQIAQINGHLVHNDGYKGDGKIIAVMDASFYKVNELSVFDSLWSNNRILDAWDFVLNQALDYSIDTIGSHGTMVLSCMGGNMPDSLIGTAPEASYLLYRTEDTSSETLTEEDNWVAAAEYADEFGADIINTSLGYSNLWDDTLNSHTYAEMDGNTTIITIAADMAASKGMLVVNSAGNSGNNEWYYITAPADGDSVLTVGAVDSDSVLTSFSSHGPTADGRMKPNVVAQGLYTVVCNLDNGIRTAHGTSFSSPVIAGMAASVWSALPGVSSMDLFHMIEESSHLYPTGNNDYGYGLPDFYEILAQMQINSVHPNENLVFPNPFDQQINIDLSLFDKNIEVEIQLINTLGEMVYKQTVLPTSMHKINFTDLIPHGLYTLKASQKSTATFWKIIK